MKDKACAECGVKNVVTACDKCNLMTCRSCAYLMPKKDELDVLHRGCVPKKHWKQLEVKQLVGSTE